MSTFPVRLLSLLSTEGAPVETLTDNDPELTLELFEAYRTGKADVFVEDGQVMAKLGRRSVREQRRAEKAQRQEALCSAIVESLEAVRPQKIGPIVAALADERGITDEKELLRFRGEVLMAFRTLRDSDNPVVSTLNGTQSNFHMQYTLTAMPDAFPVPDATQEPPEASESDTSHDVDLDGQSFEVSHDEVNLAA